MTGPREEWVTAVQLIVMHEARTWRVAPRETFTFGRAPDCTAVLPTADRGVSRRAGSFRYHDRWWWLHNDSGSSVLCLLGDRGLRIDLPPGLQVPLQQWRAEVILHGALDRYALRVRLPDLDDLPDPEAQAPPTGEHAATSTRYRAPLTDTDRLVLAARFEAYLARRHTAEPAPRSAREAAERIGWQAHAVAKRCENIRNRYLRLGAPGLRGPRALEELALLLISTGELTSTDLQRLPVTPR
jgi:predicted component of type VI protein secretion system